METSLLMMRGNSVALISSRTAQGYPEQLTPIHPDYVTLETTAGLPRYEVMLANGKSKSFHPDDIHHVRSGAQAGQLWGCGIVEQYRTSLYSALSGQHYEQDTLVSGGVPSAVVKIDEQYPSADLVDEVQSSWLRAHGNAQRRPAVIGSGFLEVTPLSWSPHDAEFVESKRLTIAECALICGLRPEDLGASIGGSGLTYGNRSDDALQRITDAYAPWMALLEEAYSELLPPGMAMEGSAEALLRTSVRERLELAQLRQALGADTPEETRDLEGDRNV